ncbi:hypothetical protein TSUD_367270 [Trifolium subterraneum]|uniref:Reverse transcriptase Ty1/copia-type domain-containing protein n=1 Tax=Trifolium subterraneum TaxID=3900 RepID=A0A2Z6PS23_TRISU|nr:hypothetical protein TSUD_367270 [Trifolium subterraneum]
MHLENAPLRRIAKAGPKSVTCKGLTRYSKGSKSVTEYLHGIKSLSDELAIIDSPLDDIDLVIHTLNGLGPEFKEISTALRARENLIGSCSIQKGKSNSVKRGYPPNRSNYYSNTNKSPQSSEIVTCQYCDKSGHTAKVCYKLHGYPAGYRNRRPAAHHTRYAQSHNDPNWILGSGATHHLTNALDDLHLSNPYQGSDKITIGDGTTLPIAHTDPTTNKIYTSRHVVFYDNQFPYLSLTQLRPPLSPHSQPISPSPHTIIPINPPHTNATPPNELPSPSTSNAIPQEALLLSDSTSAMQHTHWRQAISEEFNALIQNGTWSLVPPPPPNVNIVDCKWLFRIKRNPDGTIARHKAQLVAKGFTRSPGVDFKETFAPVVRPQTIKLILTIALGKGWPMHQLDVNNVFL